jgi:hypothetical protein
MHLLFSVLLRKKQNLDNRDDRKLIRSYLKVLSRDFSII